MMNFFSRIFGKPDFSPPSFVQEALFKKFPGIINVEWAKNGTHYEAIFYKDQLEYIALIDTEGVLAEYKMFLPEGLLPEQIKEKLTQKGEIMNAVMINKGNTICYEVILRDEKLIRYVYLLNETGTILEHHVL
ncbi:MAG TPA: hypothetical protein PLK12_10195 [Prolixibacteraceae bacterium]|nr:hypothetical protein [Prolixibacteraceae bacterium]